MFSIITELSVACCLKNNTVYLLIAASVVSEQQTYFTQIGFEITPDVSRTFCLAFCGLKALMTITTRAQTCSVHEPSQPL